MSFLLDRSYPASFKGASFFFISADINGGRKTVIHEYPNQDFRFVEDLGLNLRTFSVQAVIKGFFYEDNKKALENALNSKGIGIFVHPFLGNINCVCTGFTISESNETVNVAEYNINLVEANESTYPIATRDNRTVIADLYRKLYDSIRDDLNGQYIADFIKNIAFAADKLRSIIDTMNLIVASLDSLIPNKTEYKKKVTYINKNSYKIASPEEDIGGNISEVSELFDGLAIDSQTRFDASTQLGGFGSNDDFLDIATEEIKQKNNNQKLINGTINALAFTNMIDAAKDIDYRDEDQLNNTVETLDLTYNEMINAETNEFSNELLDQINTLRTQARIFFEQKRQIVNKIIEIETKQIPITVLAFQYYGDTNNYDGIINLNENFNPAVISGALRILEA